MSVYVDTMKAGFGNMVMCHMAADTTDELIEMAHIIGVNGKWIQCQGTYKEHLDVCLSKRKLAIAKGAVEVSQMDLARILREKIEKPKE